MRTLLSGKTNAGREKPMGEYVVYVDGSYRNGFWGAGAIVINKADGAIIVQLHDSGEDTDNLRNVRGEMQAVIIALRYVYKNLKASSVEIYHDYTGLSNWANGTWKANKPQTQDYRDRVAVARNYFAVNFVKVEAHTGVEYNERADEIAKWAIDEALKNVASSSQSSADKEEITINLSVTMYKDVLESSFGSKEAFAALIKENTPVNSASIILD